MFYFSANDRIWLTKSRLGCEQDSSRNHMFHDKGNESGRFRIFLGELPQDDLSAILVKTLIIFYRLAENLLNRT